MRTSCRYVDNRRRRSLQEHVTHRGVNPAATFLDDDDCAVYMHHLHVAANTHGVDLHVLMTNHVHLLVSSNEALRYHTRCRPSDDATCDAPRRRSRMPHRRVASFGCPAEDLHMDIQRPLRMACALSVLAMAACQPSQPDAALSPSSPDTTAPVDTVAASVSAPASMTDANRADDPSAVAVNRPQADTANSVSVSSSDVQAQAPIPQRFTDYGDSTSPALSWTPVDGARSYAVMLEDPDAAKPQPFVHWVAWNIPAGTTQLTGDLPKQAQLSQPAGMRQGMNGKQKTGYFGPRPPAGDPPHHYHFEVFALDTTLDLPADAGRDALVAALASHVLAKGDLVATSQAPAKAK